MRIYSDKLTEAHVREAFTAARSEHGARIWIDDIRSFRPRLEFLFGTEVFAEGTSVQATGHRPVGSYDLSGEKRAAAWDAWGWVIAILFAQDPDAQIGSYRNKADFIATVERYGASRPEPTDFLVLVRPDDDTELLREARRWIADNAWADISDEDDVAGLTDAQVRAGIEAHVDGGWAQFARDAS
jgi:hypothetical protein